MKIGFENALGPHAHALQLRAERTEVLARNIANADTPGFLARDVDFRAELSRQLESSPAAATPDRGLSISNAAHISEQASETPVMSALKYRVPLMPSFDGNTVDVQTEQAEFAENNLQFQASLRFLDGKFKGLLTAIKGE